MEDDFQTWLRLGEAYAHAGRHVAAIKAVERALALSPDNWTCIYVKGDILRQVHQFDQAIEAFEAVLTARPDDPAVRIALAGTYLDLGYTQQATGYIPRAEGSFRMAIDLAVAVVNNSPGFRSSAWKTIGDAAFALSRRTSFHDPESIKSSFLDLLPLFSTPADDTVSAVRATLSDQISQDSVTGNTALFLAHASFQTRALIIEADAQTIATAEFDVAVASKGLETVVDEGARAILSTQALGHVKNAVRADPMNPAYWNALGVLQFTTDIKISQHSFIMAIEADNKVCRRCIHSFARAEVNYYQSPIAWTNLGLLYVAQADLQLANHAFYRAQVLDPDYALAWVGQALVAKGHGHLVEVRALLEHAVSLPTAIVSGPALSSACC